VIDSTSPLPPHTLPNTHPLEKAINILSLFLSLSLSPQIDLLIGDMGSGEWCEVAKTIFYRERENRILFLIMWSG